MVNYLSYDFYHVGISGGKDSTALFLWCLFESGWPVERFRFTFCDTKNEDALTYAWLDMLRQYAPIEVIEPKYGFWELAKKKKRFPSARARFCTQHLKIIPSMRYVSDLMEKGTVLALNGVRQAEGKASNNRGDLEMFEVGGMYGLCDIYRPIYEFSLNDIWLMHRKYLSVDIVLCLVRDDITMNDEHKKEVIAQIIEKQLPCNPLYYMQARRVGCYLCVVANKMEIRAAAKYRPDVIDLIESREIELGRIRKEIGIKTNYSSMFARNTVPERFRTIPITTKSGEQMMVASICDVIKWSQTVRGGRQYQMEFAAFKEDDFLSCDSRAMCE